MTTRKSR